MSVEEMIIWVELHDNEKQFGKHSKPAQEIIAALKAGQVIRNAATYLQGVDAKIAWDAATKEDICTT
jgi:hypothetical protein